MDREEGQKAWNKGKIKINNNEGEKQKEMEELYKERKTRKCQKTNNYREQKITITINENKKIINNQNNNNNKTSKRKIRRKTT